MTTRIEAKIKTELDRYFEDVKETILRNQGVVYSYALGKGGFTLTADIQGDNTFWLVKQILVAGKAEFSFNPM